MIASLLLLSHHSISFPMLNIPLIPWRPWTVWVPLLTHFMLTRMLSSMLEFVNISTFQNYTTFFIILILFAPLVAQIALTLNTPNNFTSTMPKMHIGMLCWEMEGFSV